MHVEGTKRSAINIFLTGLRRRALPDHATISTSSSTDGQVLQGSWLVSQALFSSQKFSFLDTVAFRFYLTNIVQLRSN